MPDETSAASCTHSLPENPQAIAQMAYLSTMQVMNSMLQDVATFNRNNQMLYSAMASKAMIKIDTDINAGETELKQAEVFLSFSQQHVQKTTMYCLETLKQFKVLAEE